MKELSLKLVLFISLALASSCGEVKETPENVFILRAVESVKSYVSGKPTKVWSYNGQVPGPPLHINVGEIVTVRFINELPEPATVHWHGLELPANMDGSHISQKVVPPGGEFIYRFKALRAATYWYHSHWKSNEHVEKGLQGAFVVHDPAENKRLGLPPGNTVFMLDDVLLDDSNQLMPPLPKDPLKRAQTLHNGRIGNHLIINGEKQPLYPVEVGKAYRLRFVNSSNSRFYRLSWPGQKLYRIGGDLGLLPEPIEILPINKIAEKGSPIIISNPDQKLGLLLTPGERAEVYWVPQGKPGELLPLEWHDLPRGQHVGHWDAKNATVDLLPDGEDGKRPSIEVAHFQFVESSNPVRPADSIEPPKKLRKGFELSHKMMKDHSPLTMMFGHMPADENGDVVFFATAIHHKDGSMTGLPMMKLTNEMAWNAEVNEVRLIEVVNMSRGIHPFHLHGFPFQLLETEYQDEDDPSKNKIIKNNERGWREWKDTLPVPGRTGYRGRSRTISRLIVRFDDEGRAGQVVAHGGHHHKGDGSGGWLAHCHILEHARAGMGTWLNLWPEGENPYKGKKGGHHHDHGHGHGHHHGNHGDH